MKRKKLDYEKLRRKFPSMNKISSRLASFLEYGEYLTYTNEEIRNMFLSLLKTFNKDCIDLKLRYDSKISDISSFRFCSDFFNKLKISCFCF